MEITRYYHGNTYNVEDSHGNIICSFNDLKTAVTVKRYINGDSLTEEETNIAVGSIELYDEQEKEKEEERQQRRERERQKAAARKVARSAEQEEGVAQ